MESINPLRSLGMTAMFQLDTNREKGNAQEIVLNEWPFI